MFGLFASRKTKLEKKHAQLLEESHRLSHSNRKASDLKVAEAEEIWTQIQAIGPPHIGLRIQLLSVLLSRTIAVGADKCRAIGQRQELRAAMIGSFPVEHASEITVHKCRLHARLLGLQLTN